MADQTEAGVYCSSLLSCGRGVSDGNTSSGLAEGCFGLEISHISLISSAILSVI